MAKITRYPGDLKAFASDSLSGERTIFGGAATADDLASNITADFLRGWGIVGVNENPTKQDFNGLAFTLSKLIAYLHQAGVPEWDDEQEFFEHSITQTGGALYRSLSNNNIGNDPTTDDVNWKYLLTAADMTYDNTNSTLTADDVKAALDEIDGKVEGVSVGVEPSYVDGSVTITPDTDTDYALTESEASYSRLVLVDGSWTSGHAIIVPDSEKRFYVDNSAGTYDAEIKTSAGTGVTVVAGSSIILYCNGTNVEIDMSASRPLLHVQDQRAIGIDGGSGVVGVANTRVLNTVLINEITGASLASNQITLPAGTYEISAYFAGYEIEQNMIRLYDTTSASYLLEGMSCFANNTTNGYTISTLFGIFTIATESVLELRHIIYVHNSTVDFGYTCSATPASHNTYADVLIREVP